MLKSKRKARALNLGQDVPAQTHTPAAGLSLKERLAQKRKADRIRQDLIRFTTFAVLFSTFVGFVVGLAIAPKPGIGVTLGLLYTALSFKYPRQALWMFLIYMPFSGTVTYAIGSSSLLQLAKDGFYIPVWRHSILPSREAADLHPQATRAADRSAARSRPDDADLC
jgi:hypothetical protein